MKPIFALILIFGGILPLHAQSVWQYHGPRAAPLPMPNDGAQSITQYATRFSPLVGGERLNQVDLWLDGVVGGAYDTLLSYHGAEAAFAWPFPFTHVPETFEKQAVRFTAPGNGRLNSVDVFIGGSSSSEDGFNDSLKISFLPQIQTNNLVVKYGTESPTNNPTWNFYFPVGTARTSYGTRFTAPAAADSFRVSGVQFFVNGINDNTFLPAGDAVPNDTLRVRVWTLNETTDLPETMIDEVKVHMNTLTLKAWNQVDLFGIDHFVQGGQDVAITFDLIVVGLADHIALASAASNPSPLKRSLILESGVWKTIDVSTAYAGGGAQNAELWTRALFLDPADAALAENDPLTPNENAPLGSVAVELSSLTRGDWNTIELPTPIDVSENQEIWASAEVVQVGGQDIVSLITHFAEPTPRFRSAAFVTEGGNTGNWRYMQNTQFGSEFIFRMRATFGVDDETGVNDDIVLILYENTAENLPGAFLNATFVPLADLRANEFNAIDVSAWNYVFTAGTDVQIAVTAEFETNSFALAGDDGLPVESVRTTAFHPDDGWSLFNRNLLIKAHVLEPVSIESDDEMAIKTDLLQNYPNPFNPTTEIRYQKSEIGRTKLEVYDMLGREVAVLVDGVMSAGSHHISFDGSGLASGMYLVRLTTGNESHIMRMTLLK